MSSRYFDAYGRLAETSSSSLVQAARPPSREAAERNIVPDIVRKLSLHPDTCLLEIGCGPGNLAIPLSFVVREVTAVDHPSVVAQCQKRYSAGNLHWLGGEFPAVQVGTFPRILIYAVLHYLPDLPAAQELVVAAIEHLDAGGMILLGDLPNADKKLRFLASSAGQEQDRRYREENQASPNFAAYNEAMKVFDDAVGIKTFDDESILGLLRLAHGMGCDAYLLPQPANLPFGMTRDDVLLVKR